MHYGRYDIYTDVPQITSDNIIKVLRESYAVHVKNAQSCNFLLKYDAGEQPFFRKKVIRPDIDHHTVDNVANEITEFKLGFNWGYPITLIRRGEKDSGTQDEVEAIAQLNEQYEIDGNKDKTQRLGRFVEICGRGYTFVDINKNWSEGEPYFTVQALDPRFAFIVRSSRYVDRRPVLGVTFRIDTEGNVYFTCYTDRQRFEVKNLSALLADAPSADEYGWTQEENSGSLNYLGMIPIIEWNRSHDGQGCFERQIPECDNLNMLVSDFSNQVDQNTQAVWFTVDVAFPVNPDTGETETPQNGDWLAAQTTADGKTPTATPLVVPYDYSGMLNNILSRRSLILQKCNVPQRTDDINGATGIAVSDSSGWSAAETAACKQQAIMETAKMQEVKAVLKAIKASPDVPADSPLLKLRAIDVMPNIKRQRTYELTTKSNAFATLVAHGIDGLSAIKTVNMFDDPMQVYSDSKTLIDKYQKSIFEKQTQTARNTTGTYNWHSNTNTQNDDNFSPNKDRMSGDNSDQEQNSPNMK